MRKYYTYVDMYILDKNCEIASSTEQKCLVQLDLLHFIRTYHPWKDTNGMQVPYIALPYNYTKIKICALCTFGHSNGESDTVTDHRLLIAKEGDTCKGQSNL